MTSNQLIDLTPLQTRLEQTAKRKKRRDPWFPCSQMDQYGLEEGKFIRCGKYAIYHVDGIPLCEACAHVHSRFREAGIKGRMVKIRYR